MFKKTKQKKQLPINVLPLELTIAGHLWITCLKVDNCCAQPQKTGSTLIGNDRVSVTLIHRLRAKDSKLHVILQVKRPYCISIGISKKTFLVWLL